LILLSFRRYLKSRLKHQILLFNYYQLYLRGFLDAGIIKNPFELVYVDPNKIKYCSIKSGNLDFYFFEIKSFKIPKVGLIKSGDWDKNGVRFNNLDIYLAIKERFIDNIKWEETSFYHRIKNQIEVQGKVKWGCSNLAAFEKRLLYLEELFNDIKDNGYKSKRESNDKRKWDDEIKVCVSRHGELLFVDGRHRLAIAKIIELDLVPVIVTIWHKDYIDSCKLKYSKKSITPKSLLLY